MKEETGKIEYHYGFYGAVHAEYEPMNIDMEYLQEHELGNEPVRMDMLIIKHEERPLTDPVGSFFRTYNVLEYKSPVDSLTEDDFYKVQGYALLYKGITGGVPLSGMTVSIFRHIYPRDMISKLRGNGLTVEEAHPGVYRVRGAVSVPAQIVVTSKLPRDGYEAFRALSKDATKEDIAKLLSNTDPQMFDYIRPVLEVSISINRDIFEEIKEDGAMSEAVRKYFADDFKREHSYGLAEGRKEGISEGRTAGLAEGRREGILTTLTALVKDGILTVADAAKRAGMSDEDFRKKAGLE